MPPNTTSYCCDQCGKEFSRKADLARHMKTHDPNRGEKMIPCPYPNCTYKALQRSNLQTHLHTHTGERPYKCPHEGCEFKTGDPSSLTRHRRNNHGHVPKGKRRNNAESSIGPSRTIHTESRSVPYSTAMRPHNAASVDPYPHPDHDLARFNALFNTYLENPDAFQGMGIFYAF